MKIKDYFTTNHIIEGLALAILLSAFIYIEHFKLLNGYYLLGVNTILTIYGLYRLINANTPVWFFTGFFLGLFWLWWMGISFIYYNLSYLTPLVIITIGLIYGVIFLTFAYFSKKIAQRVERYFLFLYWEKTQILFKALSLILINSFEPFGFNWLKLEYNFIDTIFSFANYSYIAILLILTLFSIFKKWYILLLFIPLIDFKTPIELPPSALRDIKLVSTNVDVREKWLSQNQIKYTNLALKQIDKAIKDGKKLIILPESILPYFLNLDYTALNPLLEKSKKITIIIGALYYKDKNNFRNSAYIIKDGNYTIANKVVLVPFGEANPLPKWMSKIVNKIFFDGAVDYQADNNFTTINILNKEMKVAICYEGTASKTYQDNPKFLILISNNGWFKPSIEPTLQKIIIKYFSKVHNTTIYHSINGSKSYIIVPHPKVTNE